ncbi:MAG: 1-deoxy-D-xylulose-5-phosphate reductoisomerase [Erysipelotrichaceae bacterium]|nr:1-deoxy-D-xylulose-5-phosphate reductoisomerase [Erysipelotrichaceae bacterium]
MKKICLLGSTGSIGRQTIEIINDNIKDFSLVGVSCGKNINELRKILFSNKDIKFACVQDKENISLLEEEFKDVTFYYGDEGLIKLIDSSSYDMVVNALVGFVGFIPSVHTISKNIDLALANKESLVVGGEIINDLLKKSTSKLYPIDSEHVALAKCLKGKKKKEIKRLVITASGGSFRDLSREELTNVTKEDALKHPSWSMGEKITIDSATMMNKGFEIIEAKHLFNLPLKKIDVLLHDESVIHSLVEFVDNSYLADLGPADMKVPISYALYEGKRQKINTKVLKLEEMGTLHFRKLDLKRYPCIEYALRSIKTGGTLPCVLNASNEEAVYAFLRNEISFLEIEEIINLMISSHRVIDNPTIEDIVYIDQLTRKLTIEEIKRRH